MTTYCGWSCRTTTSFSALCSRRNSADRVRRNSGGLSWRGPGRSQISVPESEFGAAGNDSHLPQIADLGAPGRHRHAQRADGRIYPPSARQDGPAFRTARQHGLADHCVLAGALLLRDERLQRLQPRIGDFGIGTCGRSAAGVPGRGRILEGKRLPVFDLASIRSIVSWKSGIGFLGEADDEIARHQDIGARGADAFDQPQIAFAVMAAVHPLEDAVAARLHRQMQIGHQLFAGLHARRSGHRSCRWGGEVVKRIRSSPSILCPAPRSARQASCRPSGPRP